MTNKEEWNKRHGFPKDQSNSKQDISKVSKVPIKILDEVYDRGIGAYKTAYTSVREKGTYKKGTNAPPSKKLSKGTEPSGIQPPLMRQPIPSSCFSFSQTSKSFSGVGAWTIGSNTFPLQCSHFNPQIDPVIEIDGKTFFDERKCLFL